MEGRSLPVLRPKQSDKDEDLERDKDRPEKRKRVSQACVPCRKKRTKCDGAEPICASCAHTGLECNYQEDGDNRRKGSHKKKIEKLEFENKAVSKVLAAMRGSYPEQAGEICCLLFSSRQSLEHIACLIPDLPTPLGSPIDDPSTGASSATNMRGPEARPLTTMSADLLTDKGSPAGATSPSEVTSGTPSSSLNGLSNGGSQNSSKPNEQGSSSNGSSFNGVAPSNGRLGSSSKRRSKRYFSSSGADLMNISSLLIEAESSTNTSTTTPSSTGATGHRTSESHSTPSSTSSGPVVPAIGPSAIMSTWSFL